MPIPLPHAGCHTVAALNLLVTLLYKLPKGREGLASFLPPISLGPAIPLWINRINGINGIALNFLATGELLP